MTTSTVTHYGHRHSGHVFSDYPCRVTFSSERLYNTTNDICTYIIVYIDLPDAFRGLFNAPQIVSFFVQRDHWGL